MADFVADTPGFTVPAARAGLPRLDTVTGYAATLFALRAVPVGAFVAIRLATVAAVDRVR